MTPLEIETAARHMLNAIGSKFWSSDEIIGTYLYMAALEMAQETSCIENRYTTPSIQGQREYATPTRMLSVKRIKYDGRYLRRITLNQFDAITENITTEVLGRPEMYYHFDNSFGLHPAPDTADKDIVVFSYDQPSVPTASSTLEIPTQFHMYLVTGVAFYMSLKELGHPNTSRFENMWNNFSNPHSVLSRVRRAVRMVNKDQFTTTEQGQNQAPFIVGVV